MRSRGRVCGCPARAPPSWSPASPPPHAGSAPRARSAPGAAAAAQSPADTWPDLGTCEAGVARADGKRGRERPGTGRTAAPGASAPRRATVRRIVLPRGWARRCQRSLCPPWPRAETAPRGAPLPGSRRAPVTPGLRLRPAAQARGEGASFCGAGNTSEEPGRGGAVGPAPPRRQPVLGRGRAGGCWRRPVQGEKPARRHAATLASVPRRLRGPRFGYPFMSRGRDPGVWPCHR